VVDSVSEAHAPAIGSSIFMNSTQLAPYEIAMLICGIVLFLIGIGILLYQTSKRRSTKTAIAILPFAIVMIGFPAIKGLKLPGVEVETTAQSKIDKLESNPDDEKAKAELLALLQKLESQFTTENAPAGTAATLAEGYVVANDPARAEKWAHAALKKDPQSQRARVSLERARVRQLLPADLTGPLTPQGRSDLASATANLSTNPILTPSARLTLARAQVALGQTNAARTNVVLATKANTNLAAGKELLKHLNIRSN
jgi:hypothetical protein